jgi:ATP adenylyltransferase
MKDMFAPWRMQYLNAEIAGKSKGCFLCDKPKLNKDPENYILYRGKLNFILLNSYPYNPGHLMVTTFRHTAKLEDLTCEERCEHFELVTRGVALLKQVMNPEGLNVGINMGRIAGAGLDTHIHTHIVPRWAGDTNFMTVLADVKVIPEALSDTYKKLKEKLEI